MSNIVKTKIGGMG